MSLDERRRLARGLARAWMVRVSGICLGTSVLACTLPALAQTMPATTQATGQDAGLIAELQALATKLDGVKDLSTDFRQEKITPLLRKPLTSSGTVRMAGGLMRWDTLRPAASTMLISNDDVRLYYPGQSLVEVYRFDQQMVKLAASPIPRIDVLKEHFELQRAEAGEISKGADPKLFLAATLLPKSRQLQEHLDHVSLLIDRNSGYLSVMEMVDGDGDRTVVHFDGLKVNTGLRESDLRLVTPAGTKISYPLGDQGRK